MPNPPAKTSCVCPKKNENAQPISSPIDLGRNAKPPPDDLKEPWDITGLEKMICTEIKNDGTQMKLRICPKQSPIIVGGALSHSEYIIDSIDFHWGSQHTINCERFPLETHILMYCTEFGCIDEAIDKEGAAVLSVLHEFSSRTSCGICKLIPFICQIHRCVDKPIPYCVICLKDFLPENINNYFRYTGTTTFPPFKPGLEWTIFTEKLPITRIDLGNFTNICDKDGNLIITNYRELQTAPPNAEIYLMSDGADCVCSSKK